RATTSTRIPWLILDDLDLDRRVARRLSRAVAWRHHALPVAARNRQVTVVMADPSDAAGREAIASDLGVEPCIVRGDQMAIDRLVNELWCEEKQMDTPLLTLASPGGGSDEFARYVEYLKDLLGGNLRCISDEASVATLIEETGQECELVIVAMSGDAGSKGLFSRSFDAVALTGSSASVLLARRPSWPLRGILLVIQGEAWDEEATDWTLRLAEPSGASVTALAVVPPVPAMYHGLARMEGGLAELLAGDTPLGGEMRRVARRLVDRGVEGTLRLRQGSPEWEIRRELVDGQSDLLVIGGASRSGVRRLVLGDLAASLTRVVDRPMLVAR
ncbi:MAG: universal stress protein, partial [Anaerolineae bacterium]